ncbi:MAG: chemotaxis protein, partial [Methylobacteriaceae bacterium]|nr:chemotaxis protein [Methylobacteriaceae bacterium]
MAAKNDKAAKPAKRRASKPPAEPLALVGIGVCHASFRALEELFAGLPNDLGPAYIIAVRQQDGLTTETIVESLGRLTKMPVKIAADEDKLVAGHIYVGGPDDLVTVTDGTLTTRRAEQPVGHRGTVDTMLMSLAEHGQDRTVAVILSGLGSDGTAGVTATKKFGGLSIAESLNGEADAAAQGAATPAGIVDLLLPSSQIASQIVLYLRGLSSVGLAEADEEIPDDVRQLLTQIATILRNVTGNDFHGYKSNTFLRRVQRRMQVVQSPRLEAYVATLKRDRDEVHHLFQDLLIGVTQFFRDPLEFEALERELPRLFEGKGADEPFRVWV